MRCEAGLDIGGLSWEVLPQKEEGEGRSDRTEFSVMTDNIVQ